MTENTEHKEIKVDDYDFKKINYKVVKNFIIMSYDNSELKFLLNNCVFPFNDMAKYEEGDILNIELLSESNTTYNQLSKLESYQQHLINLNLPFNIKYKLAGKGYVPSIKKSLMGHTIRTHFKDGSTYIEKKDGEKIIVDNSMIHTSGGDVNIKLKGIWFNDNSYGLYWVSDSVRLTKIGILTAETKS